MKQWTGEAGLIGRQVVERDCLPVNSLPLNESAPFDYRPRAPGDRSP